MLTEIGTIRASDGSTLLRMWNVTVPAGERVLRRHSHLCFEITAVNAGSGIYTVSDKKYDMSAGDIFVFASNEQHCITYAGDGGLKITNIHFEPRLLWGNSADRLSENNINLCFSHNKNFKNRISAEQAKPLMSLFIELENEFYRNEPEYRLSVKSLLNLILIKLIRDFDYTRRDAALSSQRLHSIRLAVTYIDSNLSNAISLETLAKVARMSPNYFSTLFHKVSGITLWEYINSRRIDKAIHLIMEDTHMNILDIATSCGFNNTANFNKAFKKITGMTPTEYRAYGFI